ncbi:MAG: hypothetical protein GY754_08230 [bacterium]|nr:hypothetical protein [bacterium]
MKLIRFITFTITLTILLSGTGNANNSIQEKIYNVIRILNKYHYQELTLDKGVQDEIKRNFIERLDPGKLFFLKRDVKQLVSTRINLRSKNSNIQSFYNKAVSLYRRRLKETNRIIAALKNSKPGYNKEEHMVYYYEIDMGYAKNYAERKSRWEKHLKYNILSNYFFKAYYHEGVKNYKKDFYENEAAIRSRVVKREKRFIRELVSPPGGFQSSVASALIGSIVARFDPHTSYFSAGDKKRFESMLSKKAYSYGIFFTKNIMGEIRIDRLVPGGSAWKSAALNKGDVVLEIQYPGENKVFDTSEYSLRQIDTIVNDSKSNMIIIMVKKANGVISRVRLIKEKLTVEENRINSFILNGSEKIGYIYLPAFYVEWESNVPGCANDVAKEILKLKREKIDGLILDLRSNSGGSVMEAVSLAGIFIDEGPLCIQSSRGGKPRLLKDMNRGTVYDGPLLVLVNSRSASASEFFVAAMKDYNRAIIVGNTTYGKASSQVLLPIVSNFRKFNSAYADFIKITTNMYHNLLGETHQGDGITPHIMLPGLFGHVNSERANKNALKGKKVDKKVRYDKGKAISLGSIARNSRNRISESKKFREIKSLNKKITKILSRDEKISLNIDDFMKEMKERIDIFRSMGGNLKGSTSAYTVENSSYDAEIIRIDTFRKILNEQLIKQIGEDIYIDESYHIMEDYINN